MTARRTVQHSSPREHRGGQAIRSRAKKGRERGPEALARLEQRAWQAYYQRRLARLARLLLIVTREHFELPLWQTPYATYLATRAQLAFARRGGEGGEAEAYMRRFYAVVRRARGSRYDPARAAAAEVGWWVVHRNRAKYSDTTALVDALAELYTELYRQPKAAVRPAAHHRAEAMELSDRWVHEGKDPRSPLLGAIRSELARSYRALAQAVKT